jgi:hypothetical protein
MKAIFEMDNRDLNTTELTVYRDGKITAVVEVDPFELVRNAIDNLPEDISVSVIVLWEDFLKRMKEYTDQEYPYDEDPTGRGD